MAYNNNDIVHKYPNTNISHHLLSISITIYLLFDFLYIPIYNDYYHFLYVVTIIIPFICEKQLFIYVIHTHD